MSAAEDGDWPQLGGDGEVKGSGSSTQVWSSDMAILLSATSSETNREEKETRRREATCPKLGTVPRKTQVLRTPGAALSATALPRKKLRLEIKGAAAPSGPHEEVASPQVYLSICTTG